MTAPGWYPDSAGQLRWWDGQQWGAVQSAPRDAAHGSAPNSFAPVHGSASSSSYRQAPYAAPYPAAENPHSVPSYGAGGVPSPFPSGAAGETGGRRASSPFTSPHAPARQAQFAQDPWGNGSTVATWTEPGRTRSGLRPASIAIIVGVGLAFLGVATVVAMQLFGLIGSEPAADVTRRFAHDFMAAENCDSAVLKIINEDTTPNYRSGRRITCADLEFSANGPSFTMSVDSVSQHGDQAVAKITMRGSSSRATDGTYEITLRKIDDRWLVDTVSQTLSDADVL